jgi:hypothetical protein
MDNISQKEHLDNLKGILNSIQPAMEASRAAVDKMITPKVLESMTPSMLVMIEKSKELMSLDLSNPNELIKRQQEIVDLMANLEAEVSSEEYKKSQEPKTKENGN